MDNMKQLQDAIRREDWNGALEIMEKLEPEQRKCLEGFYVLGMLSLHCQQYEQAQGPGFVIPRIKLKISRLVWFQSKISSFSLRTPQ